jgi:hypothetical protein
MMTKELAMGIRSYIVLGLKIVVLSLLLAAGLIVASAVFVAPHVDLGDAPPPPVGPIFRAYLLMGFVDTLVVALVILRSRWSGWRLMLAAAFSLYGVMTVMAQIETAWFAPAMTTLHLSPAFIRGQFVQTLPVIAVYIPLAVLLLGRLRQPPDSTPAPALPRSMGGWAWRLAVIAVTYLVLYFGFGFVVAWQNPEVRDLYAEGANQTVFAYERLIPFQVLRALLWVVFALPVVVMARGSRWQVALVVGLLLGLPMNMFHLLPGTLMAPSVRLAHFVETATSTFLFGLVVTHLLLWRPEVVHKPLTPVAGAR